MFQGAERGEHHQRNVQSTLTVGPTWCREFHHGAIASQRAGRAVERGQPSHYQAPPAMMIACARCSARIGAEALESLCWRKSSPLSRARERAEMLEISSGK
jgi:hypothetical protein